MSNWNLDLQKWKPRQPSPELRSQIFGAESEAPRVSFDLGELSRWFLPAFGCFLLVMASLANHLQPHYGMELAATNFVMPSLTEDPGSAVPPSSARHSLMNAVPAKTMEWNFGTRPAGSSMGTLLSSYTNKLIR